MKQLNVKYNHTEWEASSAYCFWLIGSLQQPPGLHILLLQQRGVKRFQQKNTSFFISAVSIKAAGNSSPWVISAIVHILYIPFIFCSHWLETTQPAFPFASPLFVSLTWKGCCQTYNNYHFCMITLPTAWCMISNSKRGKLYNNLWTSTL